MTLARWHGSRSQRLPEAEPSFDPAEQLADLERDGVYGAVLIGRVAVFDTGAPAEVDTAYCQVANDWLAETGPAPRRVDRDSPALQRCRRIGEGTRACGRNGSSAGTASRRYLRPSLLLSEWNRWEAANDLKIPLTMHVGGTRMPPSNRGIHPGQADISWYNLCCGVGETLGWLVYSGVFDRYPDLHVVMTEGYAGWMPFAIQFFDHHWNGSRLHDLGYGQGGDMPRIDAPPSVFLSARRTPPSWGSGCDP